MKRKIIPPKQYQQYVPLKAFVAKERERQRYKIKIGIPSFYPYNHRQEEEGEEKSTTTTTTTTAFRIGYDQSRVGSVFTFCIFGGRFNAIYGTLWYGFYLVTQHDIKIGDLATFWAYIFGIGGILAHMSSSITNLIEARYASHQVFDLLDREPKIKINIDGNSNTNTSEFEFERI